MPPRRSSLHAPIVTAGTKNIRIAGIILFSSARSARLRAKKPSCMNAAAAVVAMNSVRNT